MARMPVARVMQVIGAVLVVHTIFHGHFTHDIHHSRYIKQQKIWSGNYLQTKLALCVRGRSNHSVEGEARCVRAEVVNKQATPTPAHQTSILKSTPTSPLPRRRSQFTPTQPRHPNPHTSPSANTAALHNPRPLPTSKPSTRLHSSNHHAAAQQQQLTSAPPQPAVRTGPIANAQNQHSLQAAARRSSGSHLTTAATPGTLPGPLSPVVVAKSEQHHPIPSPPVVELLPAFVPFSESTAKGDDVYARLRRYLRLLGSTSRLASIQQVAAWQQRPRAEDLGLWAVDRLAEINSLADRVAFLNHLTMQQIKSGPLAAKVAICTTWTGNLRALRRDLLPWITYHTHLGISRFYVQYDGQDPQTLKRLQNIMSLRVSFLRAPFASKEQVKAWGAYQKITPKEWRGKPGNSALIVKQVFGMRQAMQAAEAERVDWLIHLDSDELIYLGGTRSDLPSELAAQPEAVSAVSFMPFEAQLESGALVNKWEQVTLFRAHNQLMTKQAYALAHQFRLGNSVTFNHWYTNGKSAVRVSGLPPGTLQPTGPHKWFAQPRSRWVTPANPTGSYEAANAVSQSTLVLHYSYCYPDDIPGKALRSCPPEFLQAARHGNLTKVRECVQGLYDREAYMLAAQGNLTAVREFFYTTAVLSEGVPVHCYNRSKGWGWCGVRQVAQLKEALVKAGLMARINEPRMIMQQLEAQLAMFRLEHRAANQRLRAGQAHTGGTGQALPRVKSTR